MTISRSALRTKCRQRILDTSSKYFSDDILNTFIYSAIEDISVQLPPLKSTCIDLQADTYYYDMPADCQKIIAVGYYPAGHTQPFEFWKPKDRKEPDFYAEPGYYDWQPSTVSGTLSSLWISTPIRGANDDMIVDYQGKYANPIQDAHTTDLPDEYLELVLMFVRWKCLEAFSVREAGDKRPAENFIAVMETNARRAEFSYRNAIERIREIQSASAQVVWRMDKHDRVY